MARILVAEDDVELAKRLRTALVEAAHAVDVAHDGEKAWLLAGVEPYDLIVLDIMLPKPGWSVVWWSLATRRCCGDCWPT